MSSLIQRDEPECQKAEFKDDPFPLRSFYNEDDDVEFFEVETAIAALDFEDSIIMVQYKPSMETYMMNLLYAREHMEDLYKLWYHKKENRKKTG